MNVSHSISIHWTSFGVVLTLAALLVTSVLSLMTWKRSGYRRSIGILEILRLVIIAVGGFLLNQPEWVEEYRPDQKSVLAVLWDGSRSMETKDVVVGTGSDRKQISRHEAIAPLIDPGAWKSLGTETEVAIESFSGEAETDGTNLSEPRMQVAE